MSNGRLSEYAIEIATARYFMENEDWEKCTRRVGMVVAGCENSKMSVYADKFAEMIFNVDFLPGGRILRNAGRQAGSLFNCYHLPIGDSREEIGNFYRDSLILWGEGGGVGVNMSSLRPKGAPIKKVGGKSSGPVSFLEASDAIAKTIESGGSRRAAALALMNVSHPDISDFIDAKLKREVLPHYNISVAVTEDFLAAVEMNGEWEFRFAQQTYGEVKARDIWDKVINNMVKCAEPGLLNWDNLTKNNSYYYDPVMGTNPCIVGSTLIAVADGRNAVSIEQLVEEGKDVPVYSTDANSGKVEIKIGRNPRKTGHKQEVWKVVLDDGSSFVATPDHKVLTNNLNYVEIKDLKEGESLFPFNSFNSNEYRQITNVGQKMSGGRFRNRRQYRLIYEFFNGYINPKEMALHHRNFDSTDDSFDNIQPMPHRAHRKLHSDRMRGKNNPYHRMSKEWKVKFARHRGLNNGRTYNVSNEELIQIGKKLYRQYGKITEKLWIAFAKNNNYPTKLSSNYRFGKFSKFKSLVISNHKVVSVKFHGYEDVYNITVDDNHNYHIITSYEDSKFIKSSGICIKNCGEAVLSPYDVCDLGSLVLPNFITGTVNTNWKKLEEVIKVAVRFLDDVIDVNKYVLKEIDIKAHNSRRIGLGVMGLAEYLFAKGLKYGSSKSISEIERLMRFIRDTVYQTLVELADEKGAFPKFEPVAYGKASFIRKLPASLRMDVKEHGVRCVTGLAIAPTGTISLLADVTSGIEPLFRKAYIRSDRVGERMYVHPLYKSFLSAGKKLPNWYVDTDDLKPADHFEVQAIVQRYVDGAVSKTINMPSNTTPKKLSKLTLEYIRDLKGVTVYVDGCREGQILNKITEKEIKKYLKENNIEIEAGPESVDCATGKCEI